MLTTTPNSAIDVPVAERAPEPTRVRSQRSAADERKQMIALAAYYLAEQRGFEPGHEIDDWLQAERIFAALEQGAD